MNKKSPIEFPLLNFLVLRNGSPLTSFVAGQTQGEFTTTRSYVGARTGLDSAQPQVWYPLWGRPTRVSLAKRSSKPSKPPWKSLLEEWRWRISLLRSHASILVCPDRRMDTDKAPFSSGCRSFNTSYYKNSYLERTRSWFLGSFFIPLHKKEERRYALCQTGGKQEASNKHDLFRFFKWALASSPMLRSLFLSSICFLTPWSLPPKLVRLFYPSVLYCFFRFFATTCLDVTRSHRHTLASMYTQIVTRFLSYSAILLFPLVRADSSDIKLPDDTVYRSEFQPGKAWQAAQSVVSKTTSGVRKAKTESERKRGRQERIWCPD